MGQIFLLFGTAMALSVVAGVAVVCALVRVVTW